MLEKYSSPPVRFGRFASTAFIALVIFPLSLLGFPQPFKMFYPGFQPRVFSVFHVKHFKVRGLHIPNLLLQGFHFLS